MKKLMIAAVVAAMGGVVLAADCGEKLVCPFAYRIKLAGKTVVGRSTESNKVTCTDGACWAKPASLRIAGYFYGVGEAGTATCGEAPCNCKDAENYVEKTVFWDANKQEVKFESVTFDLFEVLRNGGAKNKAQVNLKLDDLNLAGFAAFNPKTGNLKSASGFFAGTLPAAQCFGSVGPCGEPAGEPDDALVFKPCAIDDASKIASSKSVAFGRWNLAYKADKVALAQKLAVEKGYTEVTVWTVPGLVTPAEFVPAN